MLKAFPISVFLICWAMFACSSDKKETSDSCVPNPCVQANRTVCVDDGGQARCDCDAGYELQGEICVPSGGDPCDPNPCDQPNRGVCVNDNGQARCDCDSGYELQGDTCVPSGSDPCDPNPCDLPNRGVCVDDGGQARCDCAAGYELQGDSCVPTGGDPCDPNPCDLPNRGVCVNDNGQARCDCDEGYVVEGDSCVPESSGDCPLGYSCLADVCVPDDMSAEQCVTDADCRENNPQAATTCNEAAAGGICLGCVDDQDCPDATVCNDYGTCSAMCDTDADCAYGNCYSDLCGLAPCSPDTPECPAGTTCIDENSDGVGMCMRIPCTEVDCSPTNPSGQCPTGATCLYGACADSCTPSPCTAELYRGTCELDQDDLPVCVCDQGYTEDPNGACVPEVCPSGWQCESGVCTDRTQPAFTCATDTDCGTGLTCSTSVPGGSCSGCTTADDCPEQHICLAATYCIRTCDVVADCHPGTTCTNGYCSKITCSVDNDECPTGTVCTDTGSETLCRAIGCE